MFEQRRGESALGKGLVKLRILQGMLVSLEKVAPSDSDIT